MRSSFLKFLAIVLATVCLFTAAVCGLGFVYCVDYDLQASTEPSFVREMARRIARDYAQLTLAKRDGGMENGEEVLLDTHRVAEMVESNVIDIDLALGITTRKDVTSYQFTFMDMNYPIVLEEGEEVPSIPALHEESRRVWINGYYHNYTLLYIQANFPVYVTVHVRNIDNPWLTLAELCYAMRDYLLLFVLGALALFLLCMAYLCWAAGKKKGRQEIVPGGLNRLPLDLYALAVCALEFFLLYHLFDGAVYNLWAYYSMYNLALVLAVCLILLSCLLPICFLFAFAAQVKAKGYWWRRSLVGRCFLLALRLLRWCWRGVKAIYGMLPVIWQWLLTAAGMVLLPVLMLVLVSMSSYRYDSFFELLFFGSLALDVALVLYGGWCFGTILKAVKSMAQGDLERKIDTRSMYACFRDCAENLNTVSQAAMVAARNQMKSERMKTELITNVSHDIKTPLTSIINYVDLLQKPHTEEENTEYLDVLSRQSQRLKKLTEDLVEMSKASTGNVQVELETVDAAEAVLQALGEFGDKLDAVPLSVVFPQPQEPVMMRCDGRLSWRVMSNLLGNAVKYGMPGTRLYVSVEAGEGQVRISFKNISRESLNVSAEELMERFVRGDASRNTEGSGLGLNIARSLMEVQGGTLALTVDGDLFKVTLTFPAV